MVRSWWVGGEVRVWLRKGATGDRSAARVGTLPRHMHMYMCRVCAASGLTRAACVPPLPDKCVCVYLLELVLVDHARAVWVILCKELDEDARAVLLGGVSQRPQVEL